MRVDEVVQPLLEMSYNKSKAEAIITGLEDGLNAHLLKLVAFPFSDELKNHFRIEVDAWLDKIQRIRLRPNNKPGKPEFYYNILFREPFEPTPEQNVASVMQGLARRYQMQPTISAADAARWLQNFHERISQRLGRAETVIDMIP